MYRRRDKYGERPGKIGSLLAIIVTVVVIGAAFWGLYYALLNWPFTLLWGFLIVILAFGALLGGLPVLLNDVWFAWFVSDDEKYD